MREFVFGVDVPEGERRQALARRLEDRLPASGCRFDPSSMLLTVQGANVFDAQRLAKAVVWAATEGTPLYVEPRIT